jgi:nicotinate-nucleotide adenylyltransferase
VRADGPSYTVRTLEWLREHLGERPVSIIVGSDAFAALHHWHQWRRLLELAHIVTVRRPGSDWQALPSPLAEAVADRWVDDPGPLTAHSAGSVLALEVTRLDISATAIRRGAAEGRSPAYLVPSNVESYIDSHDLYRDREDAAHDS